MIYFHSATHTYRNEPNCRGRIYASATQLVGRYKQPFDAAKTATRYAAKHGQTPEYWIQQWEEKRDSACARGTAFHLAKQLALPPGRRSVLFDRPHIVQAQPLTPESRLEDLPDGLYAEILLWNHEHRIAGQSDLVALETDPATGIRYCDIDDYKTNARIDLESHHDLYCGYKMMLRPLDHLMDCNRQHYELQLSIYATMLKLAGFVPRHMQFTHYPRDGGDPVYYPVEFRVDEVIKMLLARSSSP